MKIGSTEHDHKWYNIYREEQISRHSNIVFPSVVGVTWHLIDLLRSNMPRCVTNLSTYYNTLLSWIFCSPNANNCQFVRFQMWSQYIQGVLFTHLKITLRGMQWILWEASSFIKWKRAACWCISGMKQYRIFDICSTIKNKCGQFWNRCSMLFWPLNTQMQLKTC